MLLFAPLALGAGAPSKGVEGFDNLVHIGIRVGTDAT